MQLLVLLHAVTSSRVLLVDTLDRSNKKGSSEFPNTKYSFDSK
ncbi:hypothetical protein JL09_g5857 [Pichia kudriavzevii]|uniref:Uncharacterized protein n=1 Tax=Pichia kudriavzevii TaxID=4909 RepID=A0A099NSJ1_PICKU|nr:hypothetical protein JL09_g5857 [Pichia kudriavzevii]